MSRDWAYGSARGALPAHPVPVVAMLELALDDARVPTAPARMAARGLTGGFGTRITYAYGWSMLADGGVGPLVESFAVRMHRADGRHAVAVWEAVERSVCSECGASLRPTAAGVFRVHGPIAARCPGGGGAAITGRVLWPWERMKAGVSFDLAYVWDRSGLIALTYPVLVDAGALTAFVGQ